MNRRDFARVLGGSSAAVLFAPSRLRAERRFALTDGLIFMNAANLCPGSIPVVEALQRWTSALDGDPSSATKARLAQAKEETRGAVARMLRVTPEEIVLTRNTSEANNLVSSGLPLKAGDEVIVFADNHPSNNAAWKEKGARTGVAVEIVPAPAPHPGPDYYVDAFIRKTTPRTKLWTFTHVTNTVGDQLPAKDLCRAARERGILTLVDGAQTFGVLDVDLSDLQPDFYTGSAHKWPCGPREVGLLFVNRRATSLAPSVISLYGGAVGASKRSRHTASVMTPPSRRLARQSHCGIRLAPPPSSVRRASSRARSWKAFARSTASRSGPTRFPSAPPRSSRFSPRGSIRARSAPRFTTRTGSPAPRAEEPIVPGCAYLRTSTTRRRRSRKW